MLNHQRQKQAVAFLAVICMIASMFLVHAQAQPSVDVPVDVRASGLRSLRHHRIDLGVGLFAAALVVSLVIALGTIGFKTYRTALINPVEAIQAMTAYIATTATGDIATGSVDYKAVFAVGTVLFVMTLIMNMISIHLVRRFREVYE